MKASRKMILSVLALAISAGIMATVPQTAMATENNRIVDNEDQPIILDGDAPLIEDENDAVKPNPWDPGQNIMVELQNGVALQGSLATKGAVNRYSFTAPSNGTYYFYTEAAFNTIGTLYSAKTMGSGDVLKRSVLSEKSVGRMSYVLTAGQTVYLSIEGQSDVTIGTYSLWSCRESTLYLNTNGGSGSVSEMKGLDGQLVTLPSSSVAGKKSYTLTFDPQGGRVYYLTDNRKTVDCSMVGWNTNASGTGADYQGNAGFVMNGDRTLYAKWSAPKVDTLPIPVSAAEYLEFRGWYTKPQGQGTEVDENTTISSDTTIYAFWESTVKELPANTYISGELEKGKHVYYSYTAKNDRLHTFSIIPHSFHIGIYSDTTFTTQLAENAWEVTVDLKKGQRVGVLVWDPNERLSGPYEIVAKESFMLSFDPMGGTPAPALVWVPYGGSGRLVEPEEIHKNITVTFHPNGGTMKRTSFTTEMKLEGWASSPEGGTLFGCHPGSTSYLFLDNKDTTVYARWISKTLGEMTTEIPQKAGCVFLGWYDGESRGFKQNNNAKFRDDITLYAHWRTAIEITSQPTNVSVEEGKQANFTVAATGTGLTYQWKYSMDQGTTWKTPTAASAKTNTFSITAAEKWNGMKLFCRVTDAEGIEITTKVVTLTVKANGPVITTQPVNASVDSGVKASFKVAATGTGLTYQWKYSMDQGTTWKVPTAASAKTNTFSITAAEKWNGMRLFCRVTDANGKSVATKVVTLTVKANGPVITSQPANVTAASGVKANFKVAATGSGLTYQWYYSTDKGTTWKVSTASSAKTATFSITAAAKWNGMKLKCVVTDQNGKKVTSNVATLTVK